MGIFCIRRIATKRGMITAKGTAIKENVAVLSAARRKAIFLSRAMKLDSPTKLPDTGLSTML